jgi:hypothetical protein
MAEQLPQFLDALSYAAGSDRAFWLDFMTDAVGNAGSSTDGGVVTNADLTVAQNGTPNMSVNVSSGVCYVNGDTAATQGMYRCYNDSTVNKTISAAHATLSRKDLIVAHVYDNTLDFSGNNFWRIEVITGTPASSPVDPTLTTSSLKLARVNVAPAVTSIVNANIDDLGITIAPVRRGGLLKTDITGGPTFLDPVDAGKKVQFGLSTVNLTNGQTDTTTVINFPFAFGGTPIVMLTQFDNATNSYIFHTTARSSTSFTVGVRKPDNSAFNASITTQICWFAVG